MTHPIFQNLADGMMAAQRLQSPGLTPPQPSGCPSCAAAEAQCDRMAQRINELERESADAAFVSYQIGYERGRDAGKADLDLEAKARASVAESLAEVREAIHAALGNGADQWAWQPGERWLDAAVRLIQQAREDREAA